MNNNFEMNIATLFNFRDGRNVFVGLVKENASIKDGAKVKIVVDGEEKETIQIHTMFVTPPPTNNQKSFSTHEPVSLTKEIVEKHDCRLIEIKN